MMSTFWDELAEQYKELIAPIGQSLAGLEQHARNEALKRLLGHAASAMPRDNPTALSWFISSLNRTPHKWFVAQVMSLVSPVPSSMIEPLLVAALMEPNPSANRLFIEPCVRSLGRLEVGSRVTILAERSGVAENDGVRKVMYWVNRRGA